ncbi:myb-related transcription factor, partner of profilin [Paroedura picta]|uniref:myb-related transcription factor, partner of profilin n=1 Tax=Paroedura picta TaxID=143630 RepID=UPI0040562A54
MPGAGGRGEPRALPAAPSGSRAGCRGGAGMAAASSGPGAESGRLRKPRFSGEENRVLLRAVRANYGRLYGAPSRRVTAAERRRVWAAIAAEINGVASWRRTGPEVQKRWNDFKRRSREKLARLPHSTQGAAAGDPDPSEPLAHDPHAALWALLGAPDRAPSPRHAARTPPEMPTQGDASCSPETSTQTPCCTLDNGLLQPKERDSPAPPPGQTSSLQIVQLPPSLASLGCRPHPEHSPAEQLATTCPSTSPPLRRRRTRLDTPLEASLDFLQAQRETAEAIRQLTCTLRQGLERLTDIVATLLPLLPVQTNTPMNQQGATSTQMPAPSTETLPHAFIAKVEPSPEPGPQPEEGGPTAETRPSPSQPAAPRKQRKGIPTQKRRGRWKNF